ncbi:hypothetical protein MTO96_015463 [Rhipicephalus appendiculatus]
MSLLSELFVSALRERQSSKDLIPGAAKHTHGVVRQFDRASQQRQRRPSEPSSATADTATKALVRRADARRDSVAEVPRKRCSVGKRSTVTAQWHDPPEQKQRNDLPGRMKVGPIGLPPLYTHARTDVDNTYVERLDTVS